MSGAGDTVVAVLAANAGGTPTVSAAELRPLLPAASRAPEEKIIFD